MTEQYFVFLKSTGFFGKFINMEFLIINKKSMFEYF